MIINWQQFTKDAESLKPMHAENGCFVRDVQDRSPGFEDVVAPFLRAFRQLSM